MFVEEGFRIRFTNGEVIDFYADTAKDKEGWMKVLDQSIGIGSDGKSSSSSWCAMVLKREENLRRKEIRKASVEKPRHHSRVKSMIV